MTGGVRKLRKAERQEPENEGTGKNPGDGRRKREWKKTTGQAGT